MYMCEIRVHGDKSNENHIKQTSGTSQLCRGSSGWWGNNHRRQDNISAPGMPIIMTSIIK